MSLGPTGAPQEVKETPIQRVKVLGGDILKHVSEKPAERIFYFGIALLIIGLPMGIHFPFIYYGVLGLLGAILVCQFALAEREKKNGYDK